MRLEAKRSWDFSLIILLSLLTVLIIYAVPDSLTRIMVGLPFILFFPGYALIVTIFPEMLTLKSIERITLSLVLSLAVVPLIGFLLNYTSFGIRLEPILWSLALFSVLFSLLAVWRRRNATLPFLPIGLHQSVGSVKNMFEWNDNRNRVITIIMVIAIMTSIVAVAYAVAVPREGERFSDFYVLGPSGNATGYPKNLSANQSGQVIIGITNHEKHTVNYTVEIWLSNATVDNNVTTVNHLYYLDNFNAVLDNIPVDPQNWTVQWQQSYKFSVNNTGQYKLWFFLFLGEKPYQGAFNVDMKGTDASARFVNITSDISQYTLNLNLNIS